MGIDRNLSAFLAIARTGSLTAAAERLLLTQPSLTKRLRLLEDEYGAPLFERLPRGMRLTTAGQKLLVYAEAIERAYLQARETVESTKSRKLEVLRVGAGPLFRRAHLPHVFELLREEFLETRLILRADVHLRNIPLLQSGELDIVFGALAAGEDDKDILAHPITHVRLGALAHRGHKLANHRQVSAEELTRQQWMLYSDDPETTAMVRGYFIRHGLQPPEFSVQTTSYEFGLDLLATGNFIMPAPMELEQTFSSLRLAMLRLDEPLDRFPAGAYVRKSSLDYPVVRRMLELVEANALAGAVSLDHDVVDGDDDQGGRSPSASVDCR